jgi:hypothetical protein
MTLGDVQPRLELSVGDAEAGVVPRWGMATSSVLIVVLACVILSYATHSSVQSAPPEGRPSFGVGVAPHKGTIENYDVSQLGAGWYVDWGVKLDPPEPSGMEYAQMVRLHQLTECWPERTPDRSLCPYVEPYTYTLTNRSPVDPERPVSRGDLVSVAQANPGSLWLIGNEMDRRDWPGGGQDEMLPELYAQAYHELHQLIKGADPGAQIAIGGVVQPTPLRLEYLDRVLDEYQSRYHVMIPVDVWNIHNMILREASCEAYPESCYGAEIPPGIDASEGELRTWADANDVGAFKEQIRAFRQWMKAKGEQDKPLIISEYSVLYGEGYFSEDQVVDYLYATFDYLTEAVSTTVGYPADDYGLVQRWAWYSLNDDEFGGYPSYHHLFDPQTGEIMDLGIAYATYPWRETYLPIVLFDRGPVSWAPKVVPGWLRSAPPGPHPGENG